MPGWGDGNGGAISGVRAGLAWCGVAWLGLVWCGVNCAGLDWAGQWLGGGTIVEPHGKAA